MKPVLSIWARLALALPLASAAAAQTLPDAANPDAPVAPATYRSVFPDHPSVSSRGNTMDWKKANAEVGQFRRGHVDLLKWEAQHSPPGPQSAPAGPAAAGPSPGQPPAPQATTTERP